MIEFADLNRGSKSGGMSRSQAASRNHLKEDEPPKAIKLPTLPLEEQDALAVMSRQQ